MRTSPHDTGQYFNMQEGEVSEIIGRKLNCQSRWSAASTRRFLVLVICHPLPQNRCVSTCLYSEASTLEYIQVAKDIQACTPLKVLLTKHRWVILSIDDESTKNIRRAKGTIDRMRAELRVTRKGNSSGQTRNWTSHADCRPLYGKRFACYKRNEQFFHQVAFSFC